MDYGPILAQKELVERLLRQHSVGSGQDHNKRIARYFWLKSHLPALQRIGLYLQMAFCLIAIATMVIGVGLDWHPTPETIKLIVFSLIGIAIAGYVVSSLKRHVRVVEPEIQNLCTNIKQWLIVFWYQAGKSDDQPIHFIVDQVLDGLALNAMYVKDRSGDPRAVENILQRLCFAYSLAQYFGTEPLRTLVEYPDWAKEQYEILEKDERELCAKVL